MSQQAKNDYYEDDAAVAMAYAEVCNAEIRDLHAAGADIVQLDEPYMQARPDAAREFGLEALNRALEDVEGTTAVHICFGYAAIIHDRPEGYSFLPELAGCTCDQISIGTAQPNPDPAVLADLPPALAAISFEKLDGGDICRIDVESGKPPVFVKLSKEDADFYVRLNNSTRLLNTSGAMEYTPERIGPRSNRRWGARVEPSDRCHASGNCHGQRRPSTALAERGCEGNGSTLSKSGLAADTRTFHRWRQDAHSSIGFRADHSRRSFDSICCRGAH